MHHIETEVVKEALLRQKMAELQFEGEELYKVDKETIEETNKIVQELLTIKSNSM